MRRGGRHRVQRLLQDGGRCVRLAVVDVVTGVRRRAGRQVRGRREAGVGRRRHGRLQQLKHGTEHSIVERVVDQCIS